MANWPRLAGCWRVADQAFPIHIRRGGQSADRLSQHAGGLLPLIRQFGDRQDTYGDDPWAGVAQRDGVVLDAAKEACNRLYNDRNRPDWVLSRQRDRGVPLTVSPKKVLRRRTTIICYDDPAW
jgi:hypothetical protein